MGTSTTPQAFELCGGNSKARQFCSSQHPLAIQFADEGEEVTLSGARSRATNASCDPGSRACSTRHLAGPLLAELAVSDGIVLSF